MNPEPIPLATRPRSVTAVAIIFGLFAGYCGRLAVIPLHKYALHHDSILLWKALLVVGLALMYAAIAGGLWRLSPAFRIVAIIVAALHTLGEAVVMGVTPRLWPRPGAADGAEWFDCLIGCCLVIAFLLLPIFVLTWPVVVAAFESRRGGTNGR